MKRIAITLLVAILFLTACGQNSPAPQSFDTAQDKPTLIPVTETTTPSPRSTSTSTATATLHPTLTPTITPTLDPIRSTPPTIMLHRPNVNFDSLTFLKDLIPILKQNEMKVITYRDIHNDPSITATEKGKLFIITIDDIYLAYPVDPHVLEMIGVLREAGYPAVLGIVTDKEYTYPETVALLKELSASGWEIASHTDTHANLGELEKASEKLVYKEVIPSLDKIENAIGIRPITLILPEGQMVNDVGILHDMDLYWVVGINGGITYNSEEKIIYVGRESPAKTVEQTFQNMRNRFGF